MQVNRHQVVTPQYRAQSGTYRADRHPVLIPRLEEVVSLIVAHTSCCDGLLVYPITCGVTARRLNV